MIHVLVSFDENYMPYSQVMLYSLCSHTNEPVKVWLLNQKLTDVQCMAFHDFLQTKCCAEFEVITIDASLFDGMPIGTLSLETYSRIVAPQVLPSDLNRILWLDSDIIVNRDIATFYHQNFCGQYCVACKDNWSDTKYIKSHQEDMGMQYSDVYFNAGVLLLNLELLRVEVPAEIVFNACTMLKDKLLFADQDILNYLYVGHVKYADNLLYNCQRFGKKEKEKQVQYDQVVILHYTGIRKPWDIRFLDKRAKYYWKMYVQCGGIGHALHCAAFYIGGGLFSLADSFMRTCCRGLYDKIKGKVLGE